MKRKIAIVVGTRPELIKLSPVINELRRSSTVSPHVWNVGQHQDMILPLAKNLDLVFDLNFAPVERGASLNTLFAHVFNETDSRLREFHIDSILVQGDTTSAAASALAAFNSQIPIVHLEAGLRTGDNQNPFPEEANRKVISCLASLHLAPTQAARANLEREGVDSKRIYVIGNTVIDALEQSLARPAPPLSRAVMTWLGKRKLVLVTAHRRESWDQGIQNIAEAVRFLAQRNDSHGFLVITHVNPLARTPFSALLRDLPNVQVTEPLLYDEMCALMAEAKMAITDSGGLQEELTYLRVPLIVARNLTERTEILDSPRVKIVGTSVEKIVESGTEFLKHESQTDPFRIHPSDIFGDGRSALRVTRALESFFSGNAYPSDWTPTKPPPGSRESI